jgi:hypothetical protein
MIAVETTTANEFVNLVATDWEGTRKVHLDSVPRSATVGEVVSECVRGLQLPFERFYHALFRGRELSHADTLGEAGIRAEADPVELEIVPEVSAGRPRSSG